jgi:EAL domain-containing protein (putative c-di-GMP-specific phosphodiesterase class I)
VVKAAGRNGLQVFEPGMHDAVVTQNELARELRTAIGHGQLRLLFQPQVDLHSGRVTGVEALTRWEHPERGTLLPETFIPIAETSGLIGAIDDWALTAACAQMHAWDTAGIPGVRVAVNVSARRLTEGDLAETVAASTRTAGVDRSRLELEVTETLAVSPGTGAAESIAGVRALGVQVAVDDFGMGHSSFNRLRDLPLDRLKIDKSFIAPLHPDTADASVAGAMITVGRSLGMEVVAEGVETPEQLQALRSLGCTVAQGYLFGRPVPAADLEDRLRAGVPVPELAAS